MVSIVRAVLAPKVRAGTKQSSGRRHTGDMNGAGAITWGVSPRFNLGYGSCCERLIGQQVLRASADHSSGPGAAIRHPRPILQTGHPDHGRSREPWSPHPDGFGHCQDTPQIALAKSGRGATTRVKSKVDWMGSRCEDGPCTLGSTLLPHREIVGPWSRPRGVRFLCRPLMQT
jgi:hypothetical protein